MTSIETGVTTALGDPPLPRSDGEYPVGTSSRGSRVLGAITIVLLAVGIAFSLVISPADANQGNAARLLYIPVPSAIVAYVAFGVTALASAMVLWKKTEFWDVLAGASAEIGVLFTGLCLLTGMLWGRPIWGVYWTWDARLTTTALLLVLFIGYLALRRVLEGTANRAKWCAIAGIIAAIDVPIVHESTTWWVTLHQGQTVRLIGKSEIGGSMLFSLLVMMVAAMFLYAWLMVVRFRVGYLVARVDEIGLDVAVQQRRSEAGQLATGEEGA
jgi:heme exporter protein C